MVPDMKNKRFEIKNLKTVKCIRNITDKYGYGNKRGGLYQCKAGPH
jgi:hypothetical protein